MAKKKEKVVINPNSDWKSELNKIYGEGTIQKVGDRGLKLHRVPTGLPQLDYHLAGGMLPGGYPRGKIIEIYGPNGAGKTALLFAMGAEVQKEEGLQRFGMADVENALDDSWAEKQNVNISEMLIIQPDNGEQTFDISMDMVEFNLVGLLGVDSVAAITPKKILTGEASMEAGGDGLGAHARLMSEGLRSLNGVMNKGTTTVVFINQIRYKIGVMFGCFHYDTLLNFADGRSLPIGYVVNNKIEGEVYSENEETGEVEIQPITGWHDNGVVEKPEDFIHVQTRSIDGYDRLCFTLTPEHRVKAIESTYDEPKWIPASELSLKHKLMSRYTETINGTLENFIAGLVVGNADISIRDTNMGSLRLQDSQNVEYLNWKLDKLGPFFTFTEREISKSFRYDSEYTYELAKLKRKIGNRHPAHLLGNLYSPMGLAIWIMDDGHLDLSEDRMKYSISVKRFKNDKTTLDYILEMFKNIGIECLHIPSTGTIIFDKVNSIRIAKLICEYVPACMDYKLPPDYRKRYKEFRLRNNPVLKTEPVEIVEIRNASPRQMRHNLRFDISVGKNKNYFVGGIRNGILVHNSPETTTGGNALLFYASVRIELRKGKRFTATYADAGGEDEAVGQYVSVNIVKNKSAPPFRRCTLALRYDIGFDIGWDYLELAQAAGIIERSGANYSLLTGKKGKGAIIKIGNGKANTIERLRTDLELQEIIKSKLMELNPVSVAKETMVVEDDSE